MPRKKVEALVIATPLPPLSGAINFTMPAIVCPACKSKISADGKTLHEKSSYLDELLEVDAGVDELEKKIEKQNKTITTHEATITDLRSQLEAANKKPAAQPEKEKPNVGIQQKEPKRRDGGTSWWD